MSSILQVDNLTRNYGDLVLFENITFSLSPGEKMAIIAKNGTGKTSLLNAIAGKEEPEGGSVLFPGDVSFAYLEQEPSFNHENTVWQETFAYAGEKARLISHYEKALREENKSQIENISDEIERQNAWQIEVKIKQVLTHLKIGDYDKPVKELSGGQKRRLALARTLVHDPDIYLLDEPTNHLDLHMIEWLEEFLKQTKSSVLMVTHDRYFLDNVCNSIIEIDRKQLFRYEGNYNKYIERKAAAMHAETGSIAKSQNLYRTELEWMRRMPKARGTKAKYREDAFNELKKKAFSSPAEQQLKLNIQTSRLGKKISVMKNVSKHFGDITILNDFSYTFNRFEKVGIVGENGSGKSTFLNILTGLVKPDSGTIETGETIRFGYYRQTGIEFDENKKVIEAITSIAETVPGDKNSQLTASQLLTRFLFPPQVQNSFIYKLSGGEKRRLYLCTVLMTQPNFLILDEPTNDLDIETLNVLEEYLSSFNGCVIIVSHDRYFMDKVVDHLFIFKGKGNVMDFAGNYTQYRQYEVLEEARKSHEPRFTKETQRKLIQKKSFTYGEKLEYEKLSSEIEVLEKEKQKLEQKLSDTSLPQPELIETSEKIGELMQAIEIKTERWIELGEKIEKE
ncbi:MAG: ABC-F family ATP-binding cassette domain-containing protein [Bacteroidales bacterium]